MYECWYCCIFAWHSLGIYISNSMFTNELIALSAQSDCLRSRLLIWFRAMPEKCVIILTGNILLVLRYSWLTNRSPAKRQ